MKKFAILAAALMFAAPACAGAGAKGKLVNAFNNLAGTDSLSVKFTFQSTRDSLRALAGDDAEFPQKIFDSLLKSSLTVSGNSARDPAKSRSRIIFNFAGVDAMEVRNIGLELYLRTDVEELSDAFDLPDEDLDEIRKAAGQPGLEFLAAALEGEWIKITGLKKFLEQFGGGEAPNPAQLTQAQKRLLADVSKTLDESAQVTEAGQDKMGEHLVATVALRKFLPALNRFVKGFGRPGGDGLAVNPQDVPDKNLVLDAWVKDDRLTQVEFDLVRNAHLVDSKDAPPKGVEKFGFRVNFEPFTGEINAPSDAVTVDPGKILQGIVGSRLSPESFGGGTKPSQRAA